MLPPLIPLSLTRFCWKPSENQENILIKHKISLLVQTPIVLQQNICWTKTRAYALCLMQMICYTNYLYISIKSNTSHAFHFATCGQQISQIQKAKSCGAPSKDGNWTPEYLSVELEILLTVQTWKLQTLLEHHIWKETTSCLYNSFMVLRGARIFEILHPVGFFTFKLLKS